MEEGEKFGGKKLPKEFKNVSLFVVKITMSSFEVL